MAMRFELSDLTPFRYPPHWIIDLSYNKCYEVESIYEP